MKRALWNREFAGGRWIGLERTPGDFVYRYVEAHAHGGAVLDVGCGSGNTGLELDASTYGTYVGVDISDVALHMARTRSEASGRGAMNSYVRADILDYVPDRAYDVILFRDSIYYVRPYAQVAGTLARYARHLTRQGVVIVRMDDISGPYQSIVDAIDSGFDVLERDVRGRTMVAVFRPREAGAGA